ncbi:hypothetical protein SAY87_029907 [Trapa incisa]|uniref:Uncharacterized protein n=1 Tax=Trapa incisa TaxID=236973 RepID=A0AAN7KCJ6_9MYRT|nr:hypothetical protein SAY87_029907 [Trapa incisa]
MIKRRFYKVDYGDRDDLSASSSWSSDSDVEAESAELSEADSAGEVQGDAYHSSTSSGDEDDDEIEAKVLPPSPLLGKLHEKSEILKLQTKMIPSQLIL